MIAIYGDIILDEYIYGESSRLSPEAPVPVVEFKSSTLKMGGAGNVFSNIQSLTPYVEMCTATMNDLPRKQRIFSGNHYVTRIDYEHKPSWRHAYNNPEVVIVSDYNKGAIDTFDFSFCKGKKVIVDPKRNLDFYKNVWCIKPNRKEFEAFVGKFTLPNLPKLMAIASKALNVEHLIVTLGDEGVAYYYDGEYDHIPSEKVEVSDVTGAGDTFTAVLAYAVFIGMDMLEAIKLANKAAGIAVKHHGTYVITREDLGIDYNDKKIVFTNGCFDILHPGHVKYLQETKKYGDYLVIGLNSDSSVKRLKGDSRPINDENTRKFMLESLGIADEVIIFDEDTPYDLIKQIEPDVITKGGDYKKEDVIGYGLADIVIIPYTEGVSTTRIVERIKNAK